jgi:hypothetical protein
MWTSVNSYINSFRKATVKSNSQGEEADTCFMTRNVTHGPQTNRIAGDVL